MTDRHIHCVYFQYGNQKSVKGHCLLKNKIIERGFEKHCDNIVLMPSMILSYFLKHEGYCADWECADRKASRYIDRAGFNTYPIR